MALEYKTGATVVYSIKATANSGDPFLVKIEAASYGNDTTDVVIAADGLSVTLKIVSGDDDLVMTVVSPNETDEAMLFDGNAGIFRFGLTDFSDDCDLAINGTN